MTVLPTNISYELWWKQLRTDFPNFTSVPDRPNESNWISDVELLLRNDECVKLGVPRPNSFKDWRAWAARFLQSFGGIS